MATLEARLVGTDSTCKRARLGRGPGPGTDDALIAFDSTTEPKPLLLVDRGRIVGRNLRREYLTRDDLESQLREAGVTDLRQVRKAYLEGDGKFSVLRFDEGRGRPKADTRGTPGAG